MIIPSKHNGYTRDGVRRVYIDGGNDTPEKQTQIADLPDWAKPYAKESLGKAAALTASPYQAYAGERTAQFSPLQQQAFGQAGKQQVAGQLGQATGLAGLAGGSSFRDQGTAQGFMSPYMQAVVDQQMSSAQRQADIAGERRGAEFVRAGAFGGSRQAVENAEAARALASQKGEIQAKGLQSAYEQAQAQFNQEQANRLNAAQALGTLGSTQFGQEREITGDMAQYGADQRQGMQQIIDKDYEDYQNQQRAAYDQLAFMSSMIRGTPLGQTTTMYSSAPSTASQLIGLGTAAAGAYGNYSAGKKAAGGSVHSYAEGGGISSLNQPQLASMAGNMSDEQLGQMQQMPSITDLAKMTLAAEAQQRAQMRQQAMAQQAMMQQQQPQATVAEEQMAALGGLSDLPAPNLEGMDETAMADGGIVAFQVGGATYNPYEYGYTQPSAERQTEISQRAVAPTFTSTNVNIVDRARFKQMNGLPLTAEETAALKAPAPTAVPTAAATPASNAPRVDLRKGMNDPRVGLDGLTPAKAKAEQAAAAKAQPTAEKPAPTGAGAANAGLSALQAQTAAGVGDLKKQVEDLNAARTAAAEAAMERTKKGQEEDGVFGAEREKRLKSQEEGLKGSEDKNFNMALIEAGLAMMSGNSANAFENIGKGALVGTAAYTKGMDKISAKREKLDEALANLDELRYGEKKANRKELNEAQARVDNAAIENANALYAYGKDALGMTREDAKFAVQTRLQQQQIAASNRPSGEMQMIERIMREEKIPFAAAIKRATELSAKPMDLQGAYAKYLADLNPLTGEPMSFAQYVAKFQGTSSLPQGAQVRRQ